MSEQPYRVQGSRVYGNGESFNVTNNVTAKTLCNLLNTYDRTSNTTVQLEQIEKQVIEIKMTLKILEADIDKLMVMTNADTDR